MKFGKLVMAAALFMAAGSIQLQAQQETYMVKPGNVVYSLPSTVFGLTVYAESESFVAGPYAKYAQKYLGVKARETDAVTYTLKSVSLTPYVEADYSKRYVVQMRAGDSMADFLKMTAQGLVSVSDGVAAKDEVWRFSGMADEKVFGNSGISSNLTEKTTTLYRSVKTADGIENVPVRQSQVVEKSLEKKAAEVASLIFNLRQKRMDIITGDTDATFDGEAMGAAIDEINRLEQSYIELFLGKSVKDMQEMRFDVVPEAGLDRQMVIAFRFSEENGIVPVSDVSGRPVVVEITDAGTAENATEGNAGEVTSTRGYVNYRIPAVTNVRIMDGGKVLLETRVPVYQMGSVVSFPVR